MQASSRERPPVAAATAVGGGPGVETERCLASHGVVDRVFPVSRNAAWRPAVLNTIQQTTLACCLAARLTSYKYSPRALGLSVIHLLVRPDSVTG